MSEQHQPLVRTVIFTVNFTGLFQVVYSYGSQKTSAGTLCVRSGLLRKRGSFNLAPCTLWYGDPQTRVPAADARTQCIHNTGVTAAVAATSLLCSKARPCRISFCFASLPQRCRFTSLNVALARDARCACFTYCTRSFRVILMSFVF